jgi:hypothetical protein
MEIGTVIRAAVPFSKSCVEVVVEDEGGKSKPPEVSTARTFVGAPCPVMFLVNAPTCAPDDNGVVVVQAYFSMIYTSVTLRNPVSTLFQDIRLVHAYSLL